MHPVSHAIWSLVGSLACLGSVVNAAGVLEFGVVFPRNDETYAPTDKFPIVFALQNAELAKHLEPSISSTVRNESDLSTFGLSISDLTYANYSTEPYFIYKYLNIDTEGPYQVFAYTSWRSCDESGDQVSIRGTTTNSTTNFVVDFTIKKGGQEADLVAATSNDKTCSGNVGFTLNVTDETHEVPEAWREPGGTCAVLDPAYPTPAVEPCRVKIDTATAASMSAVHHAKLCRSIDPPADCPEEENAVQQLAVAGVASFAAVFGAIGFLLA